MPAEKLSFSKYKRSGMTLVELIVALTITSLILSAAVSLAFAMSNATDYSDETSQKQTQLRFSTLKISDLIRNCRLICGNPGSDIVIWRADDNGDKDINPLELVYIETANDKIRMVEFSKKTAPFVDSNISIADIKNGSAKSSLNTFSYSKYTTIVPQAENIELNFDYSPPYTKFFAISFDMPINGINTKYEISAALRSWSENLIDSDGDIVSYDDD